MANRSRINPLSVLFVLGLLCYGVYTGVNRSRNAGSIGIDVPGIDPQQNPDKTTVSVSSGVNRDATYFPPDGRTAPRERSSRSSRRNDAGREDRAGTVAGTVATRTSSVDPANIQTGRVVKIVDGDTLELLTADETLRIRLDGIDAPEAGQAYGRAARDYLGKLCFDQLAYVMVLGTDRYGRPLGDVYCGDVWVNGEMVKAGLAWWYQQYSDSLELEQLEQFARQQRRGVWADAKPTPPWEFRRR